MDRALDEALVNSGSASELNDDAGSAAFISRAVSLAHPNALRIALYQATGDPDLLAMKLDTQPVWGGTYFQPVLTDDDKQLLREKAVAFLTRSCRTEPKVPDDVELRRLMEAFNQGPVSDFTFQMGKEELSFEAFPRGVDWQNEPSESVKAAFPVIIIGAGAAGLTAAVQLQRLGIGFTVIDRNDGVGGTWHTNDYPDSRVDIASHNYQLSYMRNYPWGHWFATQPELKAYLNEVADRFDLRGNIRLKTEAVEAGWDEDSASWQVRIRRPDGVEEVLTGRALISAAGLFNQPNLPDIPGIESFSGPMFHSTNWEQGYDWTGKKIAQIGVGSTGAQLAPRLARDAESLTIYQRSPQFVGKRDGYRDPVGEEHQWLFDNMPYYWNWFCFALFHMTFDVDGLQNYDREWQKAGGKVSERNDNLRAHLQAYIREKVGHRPDLLRKVQADYPPLARRLIADNGWYDALLRDNVELVTDAIERITPNAILTADGQERPCDLIVLCSGFKTERYLWPVRYEGRDGLTLEEAWERDGARAYLGITVPGFPNFFIAYGPNGQARAGGLMGWLEIWVRYAVASIVRMIESDIASISCRQEVHDAYNERMDRALEDCTWTAPEAKSYYINEHGRQNTNMPWLPGEYYDWVKDPDFADYEIRWRK
ncbi:hypothetical protein BSL82_08780 [Tardibacter chloracetimidivorans]|uniref:Monooxygenase n=1 Tax=Tardibacter chloracetimidivorans TaxID=1921510 RepID=A0A1L3ZUT1_9SPHN|nr:NAD(P)/FAD-dependent oxidoreductase [Tardibacter chloracetimidivorans]API59392.1 hypothetical protein BSL82_08780 [Tardibacter chloracetimidivorans]